VIDKTDVLKAFPAPKFRKYQRESLLKMTEAFNSGVRCILVDAPTG